MDGSPTQGEEIISEYLHKVKLKDQNNNTFYDKLTFIFVELPKFTKKEQEIKTHFEKWLYFLNNLENFDDIPKILQEEVFEEAFKVAEIANYTLAQRLEYESSLKAYRDNINTIETAREEGLEEGLAKGRAEGRAEGEAKKAVAVAEKMLRKNILDEEVAEFTELGVDEVIEIRKYLGL